MSEMVRVENVSYSFGGERALDRVSMTLQQGELVGIVGQNGAGKTTLMRLLTTYFRPREGRVLIDGLSYDKADAIRRRIGYLPEHPPLYPAMQVEDYLRFIAGMKSVPAGRVKTRLETVLEQCNLTDVARRKIFQLSKGFRQRVGIAQALIHDPRLLILDEPTTGLDPLQVRQVRSVIRGFERERTVILSTHILSEIEAMAHRVIVLKKGRVIADQSLAEMTAPGPDGSVARLEDIFLRLTADGEEGS